MNDIPDSSPEPAPKPSPMVRIFLIVLPVGLAFMVPISLWIYYKKKYGPKPVVSQYASMLRKDLNMADFTHYVEVLTKEYGEAAIAAKEERLAGRANFIESSMDYTNTGYVVQRQSFTKQGQSHVNLLLELPGTSRARGEVVLVTARYDGGPAESLAALMCVAHALSGTGHDRTIRFAAVAQEGGGLDELRRLSIDDGKRWHTWIPLTASDPAPGETEWGEPFQPPLKARPFDVSGASLEKLRELQSAIEQAARRS